MIRAVAFALAVTAFPSAAAALSTERWTNSEPYGVFFNNYDPNFYTGFIPRVQERERIKIHIGRGNQIRVRMVLSEAAIDNYLTDQVARHDLYKEVIDARVIELTTNTAWEDYDKRFRSEGLADLAAKKGTVSPAEWRELNLQAMQKLSEGRLFHVQKDFDQMLDAWAARLAAADTPTTLEAKLDLANDLLPHRIFLWELSPQRDAALVELVGLAKAKDPSFRPKAEAFFHDVTDRIYTVRDGKLDFWEITAIYAAGTYDKTTTYKGQVIPDITTPGVWPLIPRMHGKGITGMVDYISSEGYYGLMPMLPYEYAGGITYNAIHNTGISNWIQGHPLLPLQWKTLTTGSRNGKPFNRVALTSRGPVSHGCTRLNNGHLTELREMLPSTSEGMRGIVHYRNPSQCYDVFDPKGDGDDQVMGTQYYIAFRHTDARVMRQIWSQNDREDFYRWLYGDDMVFGPIGSVTIKEACDGKFVAKKAREGKWYKDLKLYEAPNAPETIQYYVVKGRSSLAKEVMEFNRELRRVGYGYTIDRKRLFLNGSGPEQKST
jgi:hypothetical protein